MRRCRIESLGVSPPRRSLLKWGSLNHSVAAGKRCLERTRYRREDVAMLVNAGVFRDEHVCEPAFAAYIQHGLDINVEFQGRRTLSFDLLNGGCGMLSAAHLLASLMRAGELQVGMVVASDANSDERPDPSWRYEASGAAALLDLSPRAAVGFGEFAFHTLDQYEGLYSAVVSLKEPKGRLLIRREAELEQAFLKCASAAVEQALEKDGLGREQIDLVVPAQLSPAFLRRLPEAIGFPREKVADWTRELPDTHTTSTFLALERALAAGKLGEGQRALLLAFGAGVTVGAVTHAF